MAAGSVVASAAALVDSEIGRFRRPDHAAARSTVPTNRATPATRGPGERISSGRTVRTVGGRVDLALGPPCHGGVRVRPSAIAEPLTLSPLPHLPVPSRAGIRLHDCGAASGALHAGSGHCHRSRRWTARRRGTRRACRTHRAQGRRRLDARGAAHRRASSHLHLSAGSHHRCAWVASVVCGIRAWRFEPVGTGTRIEWTWIIHPASKVSAMVLPGLRWLWQGYARQSLDRLEQLMVAELA